MENKLTVVVVNDFDYIQGGASKVAIDTANILYNKGIDVIYFSAVHQDNNYQFKTISCNQTECLKSGISGSLRGINNKLAAKKLSKLLDTLDSESTIVHIHGWTKALSSSVFKVAIDKKFKVILTIHDYFTACPNGGFYNYNKNSICKYKSLSGRCLMCNCDSRNYVFKLYRIIRQLFQNKNIKKLKYVVSISDFNIEKVKLYLNKNITIKKIHNPILMNKVKRAAIENNDYYVFVGRLSKEKGADLFCRAITELNLNGVVVGDGSERKNLQNEFHNIKFVGWKESNEVMEYLKNSKAMIFSTKLYEGAPLSILEATSVGVPVIAPNTCAAVEFISEGVNGLIYDGNIGLESLKKTINKYEKMDINDISNKTYENYWENPYDNERYYNELMKYYGEILEK